MTDERNLTAEAQAEHEQVQGWVVSGYRTVFHAGVAILRGFGLPADETARAFVTGAITFCEQICQHPQMPDHMVDRTLDDCEKALQDGLQAIGILRSQIADVRRERDAETPRPADDVLDTTGTPNAETPKVVPFDRDRDGGDESDASDESGGGEPGSGTPPQTTH